MARPPSAEEGTPQHNESSPLLNSTAPNEEHQSVPPILSPWTTTQWRLMTVGALLLLTINFGLYLSVAPQIEIFEQAICQRYQSAINDTALGPTIIRVQDDICKSEPVQSELAVVLGWKDTFQNLPSIALALPYGVLADRIGRKPILILALTGLMLGETWVRFVCWVGMPVRLVWLGGLFRILGGGDMVASSMTMVIAADIFSPEERATAYFRLGSASAVAGLVATPISAWMMGAGAWLPFIVSLGIMIISMPFTFFIPETLWEAKAKRAACEATDDEDDRSNTTEPIPAKSTLVGKIANRAREFLRSAEFLWKNINVLLCVLVLFVGSTNTQSLSFLIQYATFKFHWNIARASFIITLRGVTTVATTLLLIPALSSVLTRRFHLPAAVKDLSLARGSSIFAIVGFFVTFIAPTPAVLLLGVVLVALSAPFSLAIISVSASFVSADQVATLYSAVSLVISFASILAGPVFASVYGLGLRMGLAWSGLPFALASALFALILIPIAFIRVGRQAVDGDP